MHCPVHYFGPVCSQNADLCTCCCSPDQSADFRPYDLVVYPPSQPTPPLDPEYYTVTPSGVLHVRKGEASVLIPLAAWIRERTLFTFLRRIAFFKHYILIRCFTRWHKVCRGSCSRDPLKSPEKALLSTTASSMPVVPQAWLMHLE